MHKSPIRDAPAAERIGDGDASLSAESAALAGRPWCCPAKAAAGAVVRELPGTPPDVASWIGADMDQATAAVTG